MILTSRIVTTHFCRSTALLVIGATHQKTQCDYVNAASSLIRISSEFRLRSSGQLKKKVPDASAAIGISSLVLSGMNLYLSGETGQKEMR
jgi:hypothetical protein